MFLTGRTTDDPRFAAPGVAVLGKPFDPQELVGLVRAGIGSPRDRGRSSPTGSAVGLRTAAPDLGLDPDALPAPELTATKQKEHGDFATNVALALAGRAGRPPREVAAAIVAALPEAPFVDRVEVAGPGFINLFTTEDWLHDVVRTIAGRGAGVRRAARRRANACRSSS